MIEDIDHIDPRILSAQGSSEDKRKLTPEQQAEISRLAWENAWPPKGVVDQISYNLARAREGTRKMLEQARGETNGSNGNGNGVHETLFLNETTLIAPPEGTDGNGIAPAVTLTLQPIEDVFGNKS